MDEVSTPKVVRFGTYEVDLRSGELRKNGLKVRLSGQPFQILAILLERPGELVTREELQKRLWPGDTFVDFDSGLNAAVTVAGLLFAVWAREHLGRNWSRSVTIKQGHEMITTGPYAVLRHPIYTGILAGFLGMAIAISQVRGFIVFVLIFLVFWPKLRMEEKWMRSQFGETYATYARQTAALVPYLL